MEKEEIRYNNSNEWCFTCGKKGKSGGCSECGRDSDHLKTIDVKQKKRIVKGSTKVFIPEPYLGEEWIKDLLIKSNKQYDGDKNFLRFADTLEKIHNVFKNGILPNKSVIIIAPPQMSKITFAYSCMQFALANGLKVAPILDTMEAKRLLVLGAEKPNYHVYGKVNYDEYISSDVVFITVTKTEFCTDAHHLILEVLDRRSRLGLPTFILSRYSIDILGRSDENKFFRYMLDMNNTENSLKYPVICGYQKLL